MDVSADDFVFRTRRLRARPIDAGDLELFCHLYGDPKAMRQIAAPLSREAASRTFARTLDLQRRTPMGWLLLAIDDAAAGSAIGLVGCPGFDPKASCHEIGLMLRRTANGRGFAREALIGFVRQLFTVLPAQEIRARYATTHLAIDRIGRSMGFDAIPPAAAARDGGTDRVRSARREPWMQRFGREDCDAPFPPTPAVRTHGATVPARDPIPNGLDLSRV